MKHWRIVVILAMVAGCIFWASPAAAEDGGGLTVSPTSLAFSAALYGSAPRPQSLVVSASRRTTFTASASVQDGERNWLSISPSGSLRTDQTIAVSVNPSGLAAGSYRGTVSLATSGSTVRVPVTLTITGASSLTVSPTSLTFSATIGGADPMAQSLSVTANSQITFTAGASVASGSTNWLSVSPSGTLTTNRTLAVSADQTGLVAGTYNGTISLSASSGTLRVPVTFNVSTSSTSGGGPTGAGYKLIGWNDLGMHCQDGKDYSVFGVLPPYNTIHVHLIDSSGKLVTNPSGYNLTYKAINDPRTNTLNTTSSSKTNFWQYAAALGFGSLLPDVGLKGFAMPGANNTPQKMNFNTADNTWMAEGIPILPYADSGVTNYFPMMRLTATNSSGTVVATTDIVLPVSDEMTCSVCHSSKSGYAAAMPSAGWVNDPDPAKDVKKNILKKHDDRFANTSLFQGAAAQVAYSTAGLFATISSKPVLCDACHASNALSAAGVSGIEAFTTAMHSLHAKATDPQNGQTMDSGTSRSTCYRCHPGPNTQCLRGVMGTLKTSTGANAIECQSCHGTMSAVAVPTRKGWLDMPNCQSCHTGTATNNNGQIAYTSVFTSGTTVRVAVDQTFATNPNTPMTGISLYRYSSGHGGLQCEACHGSTHGEFATPISNDNVQSTSLQGHAGVLAECTACHASAPSTVTGGPHGLHPIGSSWVSGHQSAAESGRTACQVCHGTDYRGTILSKTQADRTMAGRSFPAGTIIGCYSCHNGPNP